MPASAHPPLPPPCLGVWRSEDQRLVLEVGLDAEGAPRLTAWDQRGRLHLHERLAKWVRHTDPNARHAPSRLDHLEVELGTPGLGSTLQMMFCVQQTEPKPGGPDLMWVTAPLDTPRSAWRVHLDQGGSFYRIAMDPWDEALVDLEEGEGGWLRPYALVLPLEGAAAQAARASRPEPRSSAPSTPGGSDDVC